MKLSPTDIVKRTAAELGFQYCGIAKAAFLEKEASRLEQWLHKGYHGSMRYMENHFDKRLDPAKLVPGAKSVVSLLYNYYPEKILPAEQGLKLAKYAYGEDYHTVIKEKLFAFVDSLREQIGDINGRVFVDSGPVMERAWAERSGLGWIGKHGLLITKEQGSFFFIAELIVDLELEADLPYSKDYCGTCTACVDACPTDAILPDKTLNANQCISYLTIELKDAIGSSFKNKTDNWMFGCDICQDVCPWNRFSKPNNEARFKPSDALVDMTEHDWLELTEDVFKDLFKRSAVTRTGFSGLSRNIRFIKE